MILSDRGIQARLSAGTITVCPRPNSSALQPASLELSLSWVDDDGQTAVGGEDFLALPPNGFRLAHTVETVTLPDSIAAQLTGKSSLGRLGLMVHCIAGYIDPGFDGQIVLELKNLSSHWIVLKAGQRVAQLVFHLLDQPVERLYGHPELGSHYQHQYGDRVSHLTGYPDVDS